MALPPEEALAATGATVRAATPDDPDTRAAGLGRLTPRWVALPESTEQVSALMRAATEHDLAVVPAGGGSKLGWGPPPERCDLLLTTRRMDHVLEHAAGDLVARVEAGVRTEALAATLAAAGQELALDVPVEGATVGGTLATATAGPRRLRYGTARDLLIGITVVLADGTIARSGGKVVKNVAGYDLGKLFTGSLGTLGVITEATFRLHPLPAARAWITVTVPGPADLPDLAALAGSQTEPSAVEVDRPSAGGPLTLAALFEGVAAAGRAEAARALLGPAAVTGPEPPPWWGRAPGEEFLLELRVRPAGAVPALAAVSRAAREAGDLPVHLRGSAASAVLHLALPADAAPARAEAFVSALRSGLGAHGGRLVVWTAPADAAARLDRFGPSGAATLMRRVKERFDPDDRLSPGRLPASARPGPALEDPAPSGDRAPRGESVPAGHPAPPEGPGTQGEGERT
ncbi:glycolate oxidase [Sphaerisporangium melleum]|uniref:Glycolate oxidase n=1 Tax=Sphaerisporangium melleum TaxID=321316 RepID=A0A917VIJ2_9ACTN|nr:FAD-binding oxidoreductase [Sphaerisporangium melleum]GGK82622.1 glycolate oxidase [Sphaerisporangium melleum]GII69186.1 glycolate oxidase [Sphaerisporangium melleum]